MYQIILCFCIVILFILLSITLIGSLCITKQSSEQFTSNDIEEITFEDLCSTIRQRYKENNDRTIGVDIPRFSSKMIISNEHEQLIDGREIEKKYENDEYGVEKTTKEMVSQLIHHVDNETLQEQFEDQFEKTYTYMKENRSGDCGSTFIRLLPLVFDDSSLTKSVMKTCTQTLFILAVEYLMKFTTSYQVIDKKNSWFIDVVLCEKEVIVKHSKACISKEPNLFQFEWNLIFHIDKETKEINKIIVDIHDIVFYNYSQKKQKEFSSFISKLIRSE